MQHYTIYELNAFVTLAEKYDSNDKATMANVVRVAMNGSGREFKEFVDELRGN